MISWLLQSVVSVQMVFPLFQVVCVLLLAAGIVKIIDNKRRQTKTYLKGTWCGLNVKIISDGPIACFLAISLLGLLGVYFMNGLSAKQATAYPQSSLNGQSEYHARQR